MHVANTRIKNTARIQTEIGNLDYAVPAAVLRELERLSGDSKKAARAASALDYAGGLAGIAITGDFADAAILDYIKKHGGIVATMDAELKGRVKGAGGSVLSVANDRIILEG